MAAVIHIGANKSASTTLQRSLFSKHSALHYVGEDAAGYQDYVEILKKLMNADDIFWDSKLAESFFARQRELAQGRTFVFSSEDIMMSAIPSLCAKRLLSFIGEAHVLLVIRNQFAALESFYVSHGAYLRPAPPPYFRRYVTLDNWLWFYSTIVEHGPIASFDYWRFVQYFDKLFGPGSVKILMFEDLLENRSHFCAQLADILQLPFADVIARLEHAHERKRNTDRLHRYRKLRSQLPVRFLGFDGPVRKGPISRAISDFLNAGEPARIELPSKWKQRLSARYAAGNNALAKKYNLPLREHCYPL